jgi:hypothetical protein
MHLAAEAELDLSCEAQPSPQDHRPIAKLEDAMLRVPLDGAIQHHALDLIAERRQLLRLHGVIDALDGLLDDRSLVEIVIDVVRGGADQLYAACVSLVIGSRAFEAGQE